MIGKVEKWPETSVSWGFWSCLLHELCERNKKIKRNGSKK